MFANIVSLCVHWFFLSQFNFFCCLLIHILYHSQCQMWLNSGGYIFLTHDNDDDVQKRNEKKAESENKYYQSKTYVNGD